ncbi:MAG: ABC transporter permease [Terriglobales bacterium]
MTKPLSSDRAGAHHTSMFFRMLIRAAVLRRGRAAAALLAMIVAATVATAMLNLFVDVQSKLRKEFRNYGANVIVAAKAGQTLPPDALAKTEAALAGHGIAVPFGYVIARTSTDQPVVVSGTDFATVHKLDNWWSVSAWPKLPGEALLGARAATAIAPAAKPFDLIFRGRVIHLNPAGVLHTGAAEDSRVYLALTDFEAWTNVGASTIEVAASGPPTDVNATIARLRQVLPGADIRPVRQIMEGEARVLGKTRAMLFAACLLIIGTAALCVLATLTGWVLDRRRDFAIMKALGASRRFIAGFFAAEAAFLGTVGALVGFGFGIGIAAWIGRANFNAPVMPRFELFPLVLVGCILIALAAAIAPISVLRRVQPAMILKGE